MEIIDRFEIPYYQYLNPNSSLGEFAPKLLPDAEILQSLYRWMLLVRAFDQKSIALQRTGKIGTYPSTRGQEAVFVGIGQAMAADDIFVPYYRDMGTLLQRGVKLSEILLYWGGDERGNVTDRPHADFPYSVPVGSQPLHAVGAAFALKYKNQKRAVLTTCGEGATSQGDFYEAMNVAGIWQLPVVFVVCNNQWAISVSRTAQTSAKTIAQKAIAAGIHGEQIDGNDIIAVYDRTKLALERARESGESSLLEMICYRQHDHTTADDASRYETKAIRDAEWLKEPVERLHQYLLREKLWDSDSQATWQLKVNQMIEAAVDEYTNIEPQSLTSLFDHLYATLPAAYQAQFAELQALEVARWQK